MHATPTDESASQRRREIAAEFHERLDSAAASISALEEGGRCPPGGVEALRRQEAALRYQVRQLRAATDPAAPDIESGMHLAWQRLADRLAQLDRAAAKGTPAEDA